MIGDIRIAAGYASPLRGLPFGSPNTAYTAHFLRQNFGYAETSYILEPLGDMAF